MPGPKTLVLPAVLFAFLGASTAGCDRPSIEPRNVEVEEETTLAATQAIKPAATPVTASPTPSAETLVNIATPAGAEEPDAEGACPTGMVLVEGSYCPKVEHKCVRYLDPPGRYEKFRCAEYANPAKCAAPRKKLRFCIDRDEYVPPGKSLPDNYRSWTHASKTCAGMGKRVCKESEWNFACEGEEMRPYPYGWERDPTACNADHTDLVDSDGNLKDRRVPPGTYSRCVSPFGVRDMAGNLEEFVTIDGTTPERPAMKGAYWQPSRNHCRAAQTAHDRYYNGTETGFRCCSEAK